MNLSLPPENIRKAYDFLNFSGDKESVHWEGMGETIFKISFDFPISQGSFKRMTLGVKY